MPRAARYALASLIGATVLLAGCSGSDESSDATTTTTAATASTREAIPEGCPPGTSDEDGLCVAATGEGEEAASLTRQTFEDAALGAIVIGVWQDGEPVVVGALGDSMTGVPATTAMHHRIGNVSAAFLTTVFLQLVDEGALSLDDRLSDYLPEVPDADQVTLEQLANSTTGYAHHPSTDAFVEAYYEDPFRDWDPDELIAFGTEGGTSFEPGTDWAFSDTNLLLLGQAVEVATGESPHALIEKRIIEPLDLADTTTPQTAELAEPVLHGFTGERGVWEDSTFWNPTWVPYGGDMASAQDDVARWMEALGSGELLSEEAHETQLGPSTVGLGRNSEELYYTMGIGVTNGWLFANPSLQGYRAAVGHDADSATTIVIYVTSNPQSDEESRPGVALFQQLGELLVPDDPPAVPTG